MSFFGRLSPVRAYRDLRDFLAQRQPYELGFLALAMGVTTFLVFAFARDSRMEAPYKRNIVYVEQWRADRTDAEIRAQQAIDAPIKARRLAAEKAARDKRQADFKKLDERLDGLGI